MRELGEQLSLAAADRMVTAAITRARQLGVQVCIAVVDAGGHLIRFGRMDGAMLGSIDVAVKKARTSVLFRRPSSIMGEITQPGAHGYGLQHTNGGLACLGGGLPVTADGAAVIGAIGVSGGTIEEDVAVAEAGRQALPS